jgi:hypothetical protein
LGIAIRAVVSLSASGCGEVGQLFRYVALKMRHSHLLEIALESIVDPMPGGGYSTTGGPWEDYHR